MPFPTLEIPLPAGLTKTSLQVKVICERGAQHFYKNYLEKFFIELNNRLDIEEYQQLIDKNSLLTDVDILTCLARDLDFVLTPFLTNYLKKHKKDHPELTDVKEIYADYFANINSEQTQSPVIQAMLEPIYAAFLENIVLAIQRVAREKERIHEKFFTIHAQNIKIKHIHITSGDAHQAQARRVLILEFEYRTINRGSHFNFHRNQTSMHQLKIVYKPIHVGTQELITGESNASIISLVNRYAEPHNQLSSLRVLACIDPLQSNEQINVEHHFGFVEFCAHEPHIDFDPEEKIYDLLQLHYPNFPAYELESLSAEFIQLTQKKLTTANRRDYGTTKKEDVIKYYRLMGVFAAIAEILHLQDMHHENSLTTKGEKGFVLQAIDPEVVLVPYINRLVHPSDIIIERRTTLSELDFLKSESGAANPTPYTYFSYVLSRRLYILEEKEGEEANIGLYSHNTFFLRRNIFSHFELTTLGNYLPHFFAGYRSTLQTLYTHKQDVQEILQFHTPTACRLLLDSTQVYFEDIIDFQQEIACAEDFLRFKAQRLGIAVTDCIKEYALRIVFAKLHTSMLSSLDSQFSRSIAYTLPDLIDRWLKNSILAFYTFPDQKIVYSDKGPLMFESKVCDRFNELYLQINKNRLKDFHLIEVALKEAKNLGNQTEIIKLNRMMLLLAMNKETDEGLYHSFNANLDAILQSIKLRMQISRNNSSHLPHTPIDGINLSWEQPITKLLDEMRDYLHELFPGQSLSFPTPMPTEQASSQPS